MMSASVERVRWIRYLLAAIALGCATSSARVSLAPRPVPPALPPDAPPTSPPSDLALRPDGHGGWYATVVLFGACAEPVNALVERYTFSVVGTSRLAVMIDHDAHIMPVWFGDSFIAHLVPGDPARGQPLLVTGAIAFEGDAARALDDVASGRTAMPPRSAPALPAPDPDRELVVVRATPDRRWEPVSVRDEHQLAALPPPPVTSAPGDVAAFVWSRHAPPRHVMSASLPENAEALRSLVTLTPQFSCLD